MIAVLTRGPQEMGMTSVKGRPAGPTYLYPPVGAISPAGRGRGLGEVDLVVDIEEATGEVEVVEASATVTTTETGRMG